ncbi:Remodeling and spacing factor 1-like, partial [Homarus americanus]
MASNDEDLCTSHADFAVICSFIDKFGEKLGLTLPNIGELQSSLEDTDNVSPLVSQSVSQLLRRINKSVKLDRWERGLQRFAHSYSHQDGWELERFGFKKAKLEVKIRVLKNLLEAQFDMYKSFKDKVNLLGANELRLQPCGRDKKGVSYWFQLDECANLRVYCDDQDEETWTLVASTREELVALIAELDSESPPGASREMSVDGSHSGTATPMGLSEAPTPVDSKAPTPIASGRTSPVLDTGQDNERKDKPEESKEVATKVEVNKIKEKLEGRSDVQKVKEEDNERLDVGEKVKEKLEREDGKGMDGNLEKQKSGVCEPTKETVKEERIENVNVETKALEKVEKCVQKSDSTQDKLDTKTKTGKNTEKQEGTEEKMENLSGKGGGNEMVKGRIDEKEKTSVKIEEKEKVCDKVKEKTKLSGVYEGKDIAKRKIEEKESSEKVEENQQTSRNVEEKEKASAKVDVKHEVAGKSDGKSGNEKTLLQVKEKESIPGKTKEREKAPIKVEEKEKASVKVEEKEKTSVRADDKQKTPAKLEDKEKTSVRAEDKEKTSVKVEDKEKTAVKVEDKQKAPVKLEDKEKTSVKVEDKERTAVRVEDKQKAPAKLEDKQKTSVKVEDKERTAVRVEDKQKAPAKVEDKEKTHIKLEDKEKTAVRVEVKQKTPAKLEDKEKTSVKVEDKEKPAVRVEDKQKTPAKVEDKQKTPVKVEGGDKPSDKVEDRGKTLASTEEKQKTFTKVEEKVKSEVKLEESQKNEPKHDEKDTTKTKVEDRDKGSGSVEERKKIDVKVDEKEKAGKMEEKDKASSLLQGKERTLDKVGGSGSARETGNEKDKRPGFEAQRPPRKILWEFSKEPVSNVEKTEATRKISESGRSDQSSERKRELLAMDVQPDDTTKAICEDIAAKRERVAKERMSIQEGQDVKDRLKLGSFEKVEVKKKESVWDKLNKLKEKGEANALERESSSKDKEKRIGETEKKDSEMYKKESNSKQSSNDPHQITSTKSGHEVAKLGIEQGKAVSTEDKEKNTQKDPLDRKPFKQDEKVPVVQAAATTEPERPAFKVSDSTHRGQEEKIKEKSELSKPVVLPTGAERDSSGDGSKTQRVSSPSSSVSDKSAAGPVTKSLSTPYSKLPLSSPVPSIKDSDTSEPPQKKLKVTDIKSPESHKESLKVEHKFSSDVRHPQQELTGIKKDAETSSTAQVKVGKETGGYMKKDDNLKITDSSKTDQSSSGTGKEKMKIETIAQVGVKEEKMPSTGTTSGKKEEDKNQTLPVSDPQKLNEKPGDKSGESTGLVKITTVKDTSAKGAASVETKMEVQHGAMDVSKQTKPADKPPVREKMVLAEGEKMDIGLNTHKDLGPSKTSMKEEVKEPSTDTSKRKLEMGNLPESKVPRISEPASQTSVKSSVTQDREMKHPLSQATKDSQMKNVSKVPVDKMEIDKVSDRESPKSIRLRQEEGEGSSKPTKTTQEVGGDSSKLAKSKPEIGGDGSKSVNVTKELEGNKLPSTKTGQEVEGNKSQSTKTGQEVEGNKSQSTKIGQEVEGNKSQSTKTGQEVEGNKSQSTKTGQEVEGNKPQSTKTGQEVEGNKSQSTKTGQEVEGSTSQSTKTGQEVEGKKSQSIKTGQEVGEAIEEPLMLIKGDGEGASCQAGNPLYDRDNNESIFDTRKPWWECFHESDNTRKHQVEEAVEEDVMYFWGEGNGVDCDAGNNGDETEKSAETKQAEGGGSGTDKQGNAAPSDRKPQKEVEGLRTEGDFKEVDGVSESDEAKVNGLRTIESVEKTDKSLSRQKPESLSDNKHSSVNGKKVNEENNVCNDKDDSKSPQGNEKDGKIEDKNNKQSETHEKGNEEQSINNTEFKEREENVDVASGDKPSPDKGKVKELRKEKDNSSKVNTKSRTGRHRKGQENDGSDDDKEERHEESSKEEEDEGDEEDDEEDDDEESASTRRGRRRSLGQERGSGRGRGRPHKRQQPQGSDGEDENEVEHDEDIEEEEEEEEEEEDGLDGDEDKNKTPVPGKKRRQRGKGSTARPLPDVPRQRSVRIAKIREKEEQERRHLEAMRLKQLAEENRLRELKKKAREERRSQREMKKGRREKKEKKERERRKRKKKKRGKRRKTNPSDPWAHSSTSSSSSSEEEEEEDMDDEEEENLIFKSDHEFSPESDIEEADAQPIKRARTAKKVTTESEEEDEDDEEEEEEEDQTQCTKCGHDDHPETILLCDNCDAGWHLSCLRPPLLSVPEGDWVCPTCEHVQLVNKLQALLHEFDECQKRAHNEELRRQRIAYVNVSLSNVLPDGKKKKKKKHRGGEEDEDDDDDDDESGSDSDS